AAIIAVGVHLPAHHLQSRLELELVHVACGDEDTVLVVREGVEILHPAFAGADDPHLYSVVRPANCLGYDRGRGSSPQKTPSAFHIDRTSLPGSLPRQSYTRGLAPGGALVYDN